MTETDDFAVLAHLGYDRARLIGSGAESLVYAISDTTVLRLMRPGAAVEPLRAQADLLNEIGKAGTSHLGFAVPEIESMLTFEGRIGTLERRLPGTPLTPELERAFGRTRQRMLTQWLDASMALSSVNLERTGYGDLCRPKQPTYDTFHGYWCARLAESLASRGSLYATVDVEQIACAIPEPERPAMVHLDLYSDNLLWHAGRVSAVLDFGYASIAGDARLNALTAAIFASAGFLSKRSGDRAVVRNWLRCHGLFEHLTAAERMLAAYWAFVEDDVELELWCRTTLLER